MSTSLFLNTNYLKLLAAYFSEMFQKKVTNLSFCGSDLNREKKRIILESLDTHQKNQISWKFLLASKGFIRGWKDLHHSERSSFEYDIISPWNKVSMKQSFLFLWPSAHLQRTKSSVSTELEEEKKVLEPNGHLNHLDFSSWFILYILNAHTWWKTRIPETKSFCNQHLKKLHLHILDKSATAMHFN